MKTVKALTAGCLFWGVVSTATIAMGAEVTLVPVDASGVFTLAGNEITLDGGGQRVTFEVFLSGWDPNLDGIPQLRAYQAVVDPLTYESGTRGVLSPALIGCSTSSDCAAALGGSCSITGNPCFATADCPFPQFGEVCQGPACDFPIGVGGACRPAFISSGRLDYVFASVTDLPVVDLSTPSFRYASAAQSASVADPGTLQYAGTLALDVPVDALGTFTVSFKPSPDSLMQDENSNFISPLTIVPALVTIPCQSAADCDDGNACTNDVCQASGVCRNDPNYNTSTQCCNPATGATTTINDGNVCTDDTCDPITGLVDHSPVPIGTSCGSGADTECDNPDTCDASGVCQPNLEPSGAACGDPAVTECTAADTCNGAGACLANHAAAGTACGDPTSTDCNNPDTCNASGSCQANLTPNGTACDDGLFCNVGETCTAGACGGGNARNCSDGIACTTDTCDEITDLCDNTLDAGFCLISGVCRAESQTNPANQCEECATGVSTSAWSPKITGSACGSGSDTDCTNPDTCDGAGACLDNHELSGTACGSPTDTNCDNPDTCDGSGSCLPNREPNGTTCDDGLFCNVGESCADGVCGGGTALNCSDGVGCTDDSCDDTLDTCVNQINDANCDNEQHCDGIEVCDALADCVIAPGTVPDCDDGVGCTVDSCDEVNDRCDNTPSDILCNNGQFCDGVEICHSVADCIIQAGSVPDCNDLIECTDDSCDEVNDRCVNAPNDLFCPDDGLFCNGDELCTGGLGCDHTGSPCGGPCDEIDDRCLCEAPIALAVGTRYLNILPQPAESGPQAIVVTPACGGPPKYVGTPHNGGPRFNGNVAKLVDDPNLAAFLTPADWGNLFVKGVDIVSATTYIVQGDCGSLGTPGLSDSTSTTTTVWGDTVGEFTTLWTPPDGQVDILDVVASLEGFSNLATSPSMARIDLIANGTTGLECLPDEVITIQDIILTLDGFAGMTYAVSTHCSTPCGP